MSFNNNREEDDVGPYSKIIPGDHPFSVPTRSFLIPREEDNVGPWYSKIPHVDSQIIPGDHPIPPLPTGLETALRQGCLICKGPHFDYLCPLRRCCPFDQQLGDDFKLICVSCGNDVMDVDNGKCLQGCVQPYGKVANK